MKLKSAQFHDECWDVAYILVWNVDPDSLARFLARKLPKADLTDLCEDQEGFSGWTNIYGNAVVIALDKWGNSIADLGVLSHECNHAAMITLFRAEVEITEENQEPLAYLQDSLLRRCLKILRKK